MNYLSPSSLSTKYIYQTTPKPFPLGGIGKAFRGIFASNEAMKTQTTQKKQSAIIQPVKRDYEFFKTQKTYSVENLQVEDRKALTSDMDKYLTITSIDPHFLDFVTDADLDELTSNKRKYVYCSLNEAGKKKFKNDLCFFCFYQEDKTLYSKSNFRGSKIPWTAADIFEYAFDKELQSGRIHQDIEKVTLCQISSASNKNLCQNLEKIRLDKSLSEEQKIIKMEIELFTGPHSGRSLLRRLNRISLCPRVASLEIDLKRPIVEGSDLTISVARK